MSEYQRVTRQTTLDEIHPKLGETLRAYIEKYELEDEIASTLVICETISTKEKRGLFGRKVETMLSGVILTPKWLIYAGGNEADTIGALSAKLADLRVEDTDI